MQNNPIKILSTRPLDELLVKEAAHEGIQITELSFIETAAVDDIEIHEEIINALEKEATVVFTSMNAVDAVGFHAEEAEPGWAIYCIGHATRERVKEYFGEERIAGTGEDAGDLAETIIEDGFTEEVIFFCGNQRRDELPERLREEDIDVDEIVVYTTVPTPHKIDTDYHGILFFSPSAAESFFKVNKPSSSTILFAIGNTTAQALRRLSRNKVVTSSETDKANMVKEVIDFFIEN